MIENGENLSVEDIEINLLLDAIYMRYGYDFRNYTRSHLKRRIDRRMMLLNIKRVSCLIEKVLYEEKIFQQLLKDLSINVTEMFRFPTFYLELKEKVIPILKTYPNINIWHAGCSTGEEVLSMAILLKEEGLLGRATIFATDINKEVLEIARKGIYSIEDLEKWKLNYKLAGGQRTLSDYYKIKDEFIIFDKMLIENVSFLEHNLVMDQRFISAHLIICRNVLIYFDKKLQNRVLNLFLHTLKTGGILGLGSKEYLKFTDVNEYFDAISLENKIFIKNGEKDDFYDKN